jgi:hypothetical protein
VSPFPLSHFEYFFFYLKEEIKIHDLENLPVTWDSFNKSSFHYHF